MLIKSTNLRQARFMDFYQVMSIILSFLSNEDKAALNLAIEAEEFETAFGMLDKAMKQAQKTGVTDLLIAADDARDSVFVGFSGCIRNYNRFPDPDIAGAATSLLLITDKYGSDIIRLPQRDETGVLKNIIAELKTPENMALLQKTGLALWLPKLEEANNAFESLYLTRNEKESEYVFGLARTERDNMQAAFNKLVRAIEANAYLNGEAAYRPLAEKINTVIANVQQDVKSRTTQNRKKNSTNQ